MHFQKTIIFSSFFLVLTINLKCMVNEPNKTNQKRLTPRTRKEMLVLINLQKQGMFSQATLEGIEELNRQLEQPRKRFILKPRPQRN